MASPLVSVIIPCHNARWYVGDAIESALRQTYEPKEVILVDDGSIDDSVAVVRRFPRVTVVRQANKGGSAARNAGFRASRGKYVQFLDADDFILPGKTAAQVAALQSTCSDLAYGDWKYLYCNRDRCAFSELQVPPPPERLLEEILAGFTVLLPSSTLMTRSLVDRVSGWRESLSAAQDTDMWIRSLLAGARTCYVPGYSAIWRQWSVQSTSKGKNGHKYRCGAILRGMARARLDRMGGLRRRYRYAIAVGYLQIARGCHRIDRRLYQHCLRRTTQLMPYLSEFGTKKYRLAKLLLGYRGAEALLRARSVFSRKAGALSPEFSPEDGLPPCKGECRDAVAEPWNPRLLGANAHDPASLLREAAK